MALNFGTVMNAPSMPARQVQEKQTALATAAQFTWQAVRLPLITVLTLLEPVVRFVFSLAMVVGIVAAVVLEISAMGPTFPFLRMFAASLGFGLDLIAYYGLRFLLLR